MKVIKLFYCSTHSLKTLRQVPCENTFAKLTNNSLTKHLAKYATLLLLLLVTSFLCYAIYTRQNSIKKIKQTQVENALFNKKRTFNRCL